MRADVAGRALTLALADTEPVRERGLMEITDLGSLDGMLFRFDRPAFWTFWMKDTLIPLDIAFFASDGRFVSRTTMPPCRSNPCPTYGAAAPFLFAIEAPAGRLDFLGFGATLRVSLPASSPAVSP